MKVFSVIGISESGKTATIENIIKELKRRGYSVGSVKEIQCKDFAIDKKSTNTYRHRKAGSEVVTARAHCETDIMYSGDLDINKILEFYRQDYVVMEGVADYNCPMILCAKTVKDIIEYGSREYFGRIFLVSGVVSNEINEYKGIPVINSTNNIKKLVDFIERKV